MRHAVIVSLGMAIAAFLMAMLAIPVVVYLAASRRIGDPTAPGVNIGIPAWALKVALPAAVIVGTITFVLTYIRAGRDP